MGEVISLISANGGTGKTTAVVNLSEALALKGQKVLVIDMNTGVTALDFHMNIVNKTVYHIYDVLKGHCTIIQAFVRCESFGQLFVLPGTGSVKDAVIKEEEFHRLVRILKTQFDYILIDTPSGLSSRVETSVASSDRVILVTTPYASSVRAAKASLSLLSEDLKGRSALLLTRLRTDLLRSASFPAPENVVTEIGLPLIGVLTESTDILLESQEGVSVMERTAPSSRAFSNIASRLLGENVPIIIKGK